LRSDKANILIAALGTLLFLIFVLPFYVFLPYTIINSETQIYPFEIGVFRFIGTVPIFIGVLTFLWSAGNLTFSGKGTPCHLNPPEEFVVRGLYRYVRNPMYLGGIIIVVGEALLFESTNLFIYALAMFAFFNLFIVVEEYTLKQSFGESYMQYCKFVPRWIPCLNGFQGDMSKSS
jgi:protein-S-isoprenylcysteine O-methyltransferase Ste14